MIYIFVDESWDDYLYWQQHDKKKVTKELASILNVTEEEMAKRLEALRS